MTSLAYHCHQFALSHTSSPKPNPMKTLPVINHLSVLVPHFYIKIKLGSGKNKTKQNTILLALKVTWLFFMELLLIIVMSSVSK